MIFSGYVFQAVPLERGVARLLEKIYDQGHRAVVKLDTEEEKQLFDTSLWTFHPTSFLPHGRDDGLKPQEQPILLTCNDRVFKNPPNQATIAMSFQAQSLFELAKEGLHAFQRLIWVSSSVLLSDQQDALTLALPGAAKAMHIQDAKGAWAKYDL